ncbi:hypothetical protein Mapa_008105 [Marchantia paleacea]|nr:hypothetical protein Mapa_008105 [Marchantia paleacea]
MNKIKAFTKMGSHNYEQLGHQPQPDVASRNNWGHVGDDDDVIVRIDRQSGSQERVLLHRTEDSPLAQRSSHSSPISAAVAAVAAASSVPTVTPTLLNGGHSHQAPRGPVPSAAFRRTCSSIASTPTVSPAATSAEEERGGGGGGAEVEGARGAEVEKGTSLVRESSYNFWSDEPEPERPGGWNKVDEGRINEERCSSSLHRRAKSFEFGGGSSNEADPPSRLIREFLQKQSATGSTFLDLDMDMEELTAKGRPLRPGANGNGSGHGNGVPAAAAAGTNSNKRMSPGQSKENRMLQVDQDSSSSFDSPSPKGFRDSPTTTSRSRDQLGSPGVRRPGEVVVDMPQNHKTSDFSSSSEEVSPLHEVAALGGVGIRSRKAFPHPQMVIDRKNSSSGGPGAGAGAGGELDQMPRSPVAYNKPPGFNRLKSRLVDVPKPPDLKAGEGKEEGRRSGGMSGALRSGLLGKLKRVDEEDDDPLKDADLPEKFRTRDKGFWTVAQWVSFLLILGGLATILAFKNLREMKRGGLMLWKWALLVMVVFSGRLVSGWIIWFFVIIIERNFLLRKRVLYFVYALRKGVQNCLWLGFALLAWHLMIDPKVDKDIAVVKYVTKILQCFLIGALIILVKTLIVKVFASSFHVSNFFERIQEALFNQYIMETLSGPPMLEIEQNLEEEMKFNEEIASLKEAGATGPNLPKMNDLPPLPPRRSGINGASQMLNKSGGTPGGTKSGMIGKTAKPGEKKTQKLEEEGISVEHLTKLDQRNVSAWNMKRLVNIIRHSSLTHSIEETVYAEGGVETEIQSEWQAKKAAKQIFKNVARKGAKVISEEDLLRFMREEEATKALHSFEGGFETKKITKQALKNWVINVYRERRALALSLNDTKTAVNKLHRIVDVIVGVIILVIWLLVLDIATTQLLLFTSSQFLLVILVWGNTLKTVLEAIVFLFVMHPFDVGDRCVVDGQQLVVEEMNILTTVFLGDYNVKIWYPNSVLATKPIQNYYRSPDMGDSVDFLTLTSTPMSKINELKESIKEYLLSKPQWWAPEFTLNVMEMTEGKRMKLTLGLKHTMNFQDLGERFKRKGELQYELKSRCTKLEIDFKPPAGEFNVNLRQEGPHEISLRKLE